MTALQREATIRWLGYPPGGAPRLTVGSHSIAPSLSLNVDPDATNPLGTSPGELLAGAIGSVFAWFIAEQLLEEGTQARELVARVMVTSGEGEDDRSLALRAIDCEMAGRIANIDEAHLETVAQAAMTRCIEHLGMRSEGLAVTVEASLEGG